MAASQLQEYESSFTGPIFYPPVYSQRYSVALEAAARTKAKTVVDMGCAEGKLLGLMKRQAHVEELMGVDVDPQLLRRQESTIQPLTTDYLLLRERPLHITLMQGSIAEPDQRIANCDLLTCIEVIEHLESDVLEKVPQSLFGAVHPKTILLTTPNADFNVLFPDLRGFRHYDHKFEWTREQFQSWCSKFAQKYNYSVEFSGVGKPPPGREDLGYCSQIATFTSQRSPHSCRDEPVLRLGTPYTVITEATYPYLANPPSEKEKLCHAAVYYFNLILQGLKRYGAESEEESGGEEELDNHCRHCKGLIDVGTVHVALKKLLKFQQIQQLCASEDEIRSALELTTSITLEHTNTCAVFQEVDSISDCSSEHSTHDESAEPGNSTIDIGVSSTTQMSGNDSNNKNGESWE